MPPIDIWQNALTLPRRITVNSTQEIADLVNRKPASQRYNGEPKKATCLDIFSPQRVVEVFPVDILYSIGRITTPRIENLADLCSTWARTRYIWAFNPQPRNGSLCLSDEAKNIDFHQKGLLSDEIGVGLADLIVKRFLGGQNPVDVDVALRNQYVAGMARRYSTSPDYIFERLNGDYIILECKGTQSGRSTALSQLKRGTEQVTSLEFPPGTTVLTLIVGTDLSTTGTTVYVIDPPSGKSHGSRRDKKVLRDEKKFRMDYEDAHLSNLYLYLGVTAKAAMYTPDEEKKKALLKGRQVDEPPQRHRFVELGNEEYVGVGQDVNFLGDQSRVNIFQGMPESLYQELETERFRFDMHGRNFHNRMRHSTKSISHDLYLEESASIVLSDRTNNALMVSVIGHDGTMLRLEVSQ